MMSEYDEGFEEFDYEEELADEYGDTENDNVTDEYLAYFCLLYTSDAADE